MHIIDFLITINAPHSKLSSPNFYPLYSFMRNIFERDYSMIVGYAYRSVFAEMCSLDNISTVGVVNQSFGVFALDAINVNGLVVQKLLKGVAICDITMFLAFTCSDQVP